jgi:hypothetical protein
MRRSSLFLALIAIYPIVGLHKDCASSRQERTEYLG